MDDAYLVEPPVDLKRQIEKYVHTVVEYNTSYHLSGPYKSNNLLSRSNCIRFQNELSDFMLPESIVTQLLPHLVSHRYWDRRFSVLAQWTYINMEETGGLVEVDTVDRRNLRYSSLTWLGYTFQPSLDVPVVFSVLTNTRYPQTLSLRIVERLAEWGAFATAADQYAYEHQLRAIEQDKEQQREELQRHLDSLSDVGSQYSRYADSLVVVLQHDSASFADQQMRAQVLRTKKRMNREQIFIMSLQPARSDYMFGLEFNLYNCFKKTISKIEITVAPYNSRNRVQEDKFHRTVRTVRCMGPIAPGEPAQYTFDELFWDDSGKIRYMKVTSITFHFPDGTSRSFNGYSTVMKHSLNR